MGTGICSIMPQIALAAGAAEWCIETWNSCGYGPWSDGTTRQLFVDPIPLSAYRPNAIWAYLNSAPPGGASQASRRERIMAAWLGAGRFGPLDSPQGKTRVALLIDTNAANKKLSIDLLSERSAMLADVRDEISLMKRELHDLLGKIRVSAAGTD
jgi:hypothetical protein